jgi:hypothetical protein
MDYDEGKHVKEVFAYFGLAAYTASCLESGLAHALLYIEFLARVQKEFDRTKGKGFDRRRYEDDFDAFLKSQFALTLGNLIRRVNDLTTLDDSLRRRIRAAKARRDFLMHHFWREKAVEFATPEGRSNMIEELRCDVEEFEKLDRDLIDGMKSAREKVGVGDEWLEARAKLEMERMLNSSAKSRA